MYYVMVDYGCGEVECVGEYDYVNDAIERCDMFEDAWISSDEDDEPADIDSDFGYDPYMGECTYDC